MQDVETAEALAKLFGKNEHPVKFQRHKYEIALLEKELAAVTKAKRTRVSGALFGIFKARKSMPLERKVEILNERIEELKAAEVDAFLVRLTEREHLIAVKDYTSLRHFMLSELNKQQLSPDGRTSEEYAIDLVCETLFASKLVQYSLKRKTGDGWMPVFTSQEMARVDPRLTRELLDIYNREFVLSQGAIKKS